MIPRKTFAMKNDHVRDATKMTYGLRKCDEMTDAVSWRSVNRSGKRCGKRCEAFVKPKGEEGSKV